MRLIKMTGGLGNQMFIYAFYLKMKKLFSSYKDRLIGYDALPCTSRI